MILDGQVATAIAAAAQALKEGELVGVPTETVYGLGADAGNDAAMAKIFAAKGRPADHPLIVHIARAAELDDWARDVPLAAHTLAAAFWPGPLTLVLKRASHVLDLVTGGRPTVGLRVPAHPLALRLLERFAGGVAAPSANRFGRVSPTTAAHVIADLGTDVDIVLDGGPCEVGLESTIVDLSGEPTILRPGGITAERITEVLGTKIGYDTQGPARAPGMLATHYAPRCRIELVPVDEVADRIAALARQGFTVRALDAARPDELAPRLYAQMRAADADGIEVLVAALPADVGLGAAVADRLRKAAGPRDQDDRP
jgi:L-threonylcarbamoyladenylate synthase